MEMRGTNPAWSSIPAPLFACGTHSSSSWVPITYFEKPAASPFWWSFVMIAWEVLLGLSRSGYWYIFWDGGRGESNNAGTNGKSHLHRPLTMITYYLILRAARQKKVFFSIFLAVVAFPENLVLHRPFCNQSIKWEVIIGCRRSILLTGCSRTLNYYSLLLLSRRLEQADYSLFYVFSPSPSISLEHAARCFRLALL